MTADPHDLPGGFSSFWKQPDQRYSVNNKNNRFWLTIIVEIESVVWKSTGIDRIGGEYCYTPRGAPTSLQDHYWIQNEIQKAICFLLICNILDIIQSKREKIQIIALGR